MAYEFGSFRLEPGSRRLLRAGNEVALTAKAFDILVTLVDKAGQVVDKGVLLSRLWPDTVVEEGNLAQQVHTARRALGDDEQRYIRTVARRGYQFVAEVRKSAEAPGPSVQPAVATLAVLPFRLLSTDETDEHLGLGLADALITRLSNVRQVLVRPTSSVLRYSMGAPSPVEAARQLNVRWLLEGSFRREPERLRVTVQLLAMPEGVPVWGETFSDQRVDPFSAQDAIAHRVAEALVPCLSLEEERRLSVAPTRDHLAFESYLRGRFHAARRTESDLSRSIELFEAALARDTDFALARAALAESLTLQGSAGYGSHSEAQALARAFTEASRAVELEPALAEAYATLGFVRFRAHWDWLGAQNALEEAIELKPTCASGHHFLGLLLAALGRFEPALAAVRKAEELDPLSPNIGTAVGRVLHFARRYDEAIGQLTRICTRDPGFSGAHGDLGLALFQTGRLDEARIRLERARELSGGRAVITSVLGHVLAASGNVAEAERLLDAVRQAAPGTHLPAYVLLGLNRHQEALDLLEPACEARAGVLVYLKVEPLYDRVRDDPRFARLLEMARLTD
jgi:serine/threonine-protein kinase